MVSERAKPNGKPEVCRRPAPRVTTAFRKIRMLGTAGLDRHLFHYQLENVSRSGAGLFVPKQPNLPEFFPGMNICTHLPFFAEGELRDAGTLVRTEEREDGVFLGMVLLDTVIACYPVFLEVKDASGEARLTTSVEDLGPLFYRVLKDACFLKQGVLIYLDHLIPVFLRGSAVRRRLDPAEAVREFTRARKTLQRDCETMERMRRLCRPEMDLASPPAGWDWPALTRAAASDGGVTYLMNVFRLREVGPYVHSIRLLDHRLFTNHNTMAVIHELAGAASLQAA